MNLLEKLELWGDRHHPKWLDIIRIALGLFLCYKGIDFLRHNSNLMAVMKTSSPFSAFINIIVGHYATFGHILGGIFLTLGLYTRVACLIQIPILIGAIFFVNMQSAGNGFTPYSELFLAIIVLLLLIYFLIVGNGPISLKIPDEEHLKEHQEYINKVK